ncbi:MAG: ATP-binding protein [Candidatus Pacebacteria bacterium]|nr:ATP-binding protein [Candidatus Paceibacterota bacterium]
MIKREIIEKIYPWIGKEKILILNGARQVGKTTLLKQIEEKLTKENQNSSVVYLLADDIENESIFNSPASLELYLKQFHKFPSQYLYLIIDEFQIINQAGLFLKNLFDKYKDKMQIIVSGSSSLEISKCNEFLTGRAIHFNIERISFKEYFDFVYQTETEKIALADFKELELFHQTFQSKLELSLNDYLTFGGYPEVITTEEVDNKKIILKSILKTYLEKDVVNFLKVENVSGFNNLSKVLSSQIGNLVNASELSGTINLATNTLNKYLDILVGTYIFNLVTPYYQNVRSEISKMPKVYVLDLGIRNYLLRSFVLDDFTNKGSIIENFVYLNLLSQFKKDYLHFYRTISGAEIDFIIEKENEKNILCEVKYRSKVTVPLAIKNFQKKYPDLVDQKIIVTKDLLKEENDVCYLPAVLLPFVKL